MPLNQPNRGYSVYESDDGSSYCVQSDAEWIAHSGHGGDACTTERAFGRQSSRRHLRKAVYRDPTTFRTHSGPIFTAAAYAALTIGSSTFDVTVPDQATAVTYTLVAKTPEKVMGTVIGQQVLDHA